MLLLQTHGSMTARDLAARLEVSPRTIYRDIEALSIAGVPVYTVTGSNGGTCLDEHYRVSLTGLKRDELQSLFLANPAGLLRDLGLDRAATGTLLKLRSVLPAIQRQQVEHLRQRIYIDPEGWFQTGEPMPFLPVLQQAVWQNEIIELTYGSPGGKVTRRTIEPCALVAKSNLWYLVGRQGDGAWRTFRVARIQAVELSGASFERDSEFDLVGYWTESSRRFADRVMEDEQPYPVVVRVDREQLRFFTANLIGMYKVLDADDGEWARVAINFPSFAAARIHILAFSPSVQVLEPQGFREWVREAAKRAARLHE